jgi:hypothetical protein
MNAKEFDAANEYRSENWTECPLMAEYLEMALEHINSQDKQIAALKAALIMERAAQGTGLMFWNQAPTAFKELYTQKAKAQLARELPEIFGDDKQ